ncbi:hypothetical protein RQP46_009863 [Phenoliferia psychrophenolica]
MSTPTYTGPQKLVLCIDVGTTQTGCSIIRCDPGVAPTIRVINHYPGDPTSSKVPTRMYYDKTGTPRAYGSEVFNEVVVAQAEEEGWELAAFWKLHLHPEGLSPPEYTPSDTVWEEFELVGSNSKFDISPLPKNVPVGQIYRDWFTWLVKAAQKFYEETNRDGEVVWKNLSGKMEFVVAHPNSYGFAEQTVLRKTLEAASLIKADDGVGEQRLRFVTEAECSVYFGLQHFPHDWLKIGSQLAVVDLGGSTVDITVYSVNQVEPKLVLREIQAGGIYVTQAGRKLIQAKLRDSRFIENLDFMVSEFDMKTKCNYEGAEKSSIIKFGLPRDNDSAVKISRGRLTLTGAEVEEAFSSCLESIIEALDDQLAGTINILTVGGFSESPYLQNKLRATYAPRGMSFVHADEPAIKAVAEGAALFHIKDSVVARATRFAYGIQMYVPVSYIPESENADLEGRETFEDVDGVVKVNGVWDEIMYKGEVAEVGETYSHEYHRMYSTKKLSIRMKTTLYALHGPLANAEQKGNCFMRAKDYSLLDDFKPICVLNATLKDICKPEHNFTTNKDYYVADFKVCIGFGGTSLEAHVEWDEDGITKTEESDAVQNVIRAVHALRESDRGIAREAEAKSLIKALIDKERIRTLEAELASLRARSTERDGQLVESQRQVEAGLRREDAARLRALEVARSFDTMQKTIKAFQEAIIASNRLAKASAESDRLAKEAAARRPPPPPVVAAAIPPPLAVKVATPPPYIETPATPLLEKSLPLRRPPVTPMPISYTLGTFTHGRAWYTTRGKYWLEDGFLPECVRHEDLSKIWEAEKKAIPRGYVYKQTFVDGLAEIRKGHGCYR